MTHRMLPIPDGVVAVTVGVAPPPATRKTVRIPLPVRPATPLIQRHVPARVLEAVHAVAMAGAPLPAELRAAIAFPPPPET